MENDDISDKSIDSLENDKDNNESFFNQNISSEIENQTFVDNNNITVSSLANSKTASKVRDNRDSISHAKYYTEIFRDPGKEGRNASRLLFLRSYNNWIKASIINKYTRLLGDQLSVLDLCCGRGGDLEKYFRSSVRHYIGADLAEEALKNALERIVKLTNEKFKDLKCKCMFITEDLSHPDNMLLKKIPSEIYFDLVSCQFAFHYHFESEQRLRNFLTNVVSKLSDGGYFMVTIIDSNILVKRLRERNNTENLFKDEKFAFGNEFYSVKFYQKKFPKDNMFGIKYGFYLEDSLDKRDENSNIKYIDEYLIYFPILEKICLEFDMHLVEKKNFCEFYQENIDNKFYGNMFRKMVKELNNTTREKQWDIIQLYQFIVFRKGKQEKPKRYVPVIKRNRIEIKEAKPFLITDKFE